MANFMLFYKNIIPISRETHKNYKFNPPGNAAFAANTHWVPIAGEEFYHAAISYPILFSGVENQSGKIVYTALALLGLAPNMNDFLNEHQHWQAECYIPAFVRRYPFILGGSVDQKDFSICFDSESGMFNQIKGYDLFNSDGSVSSFMDERIKFLNSFKNSMEITNDFIEMINKMGLLTKQSLNIKNSAGQAARLEDFWIIDSKKLNKLSGDQLAKLNNKGYLGWVFSQIISMNNLSALLNLHVAKQNNMAEKDKNLAKPNNKADKKVLEEKAAHK